MSGRTLVEVFGHGGVILIFNVIVVPLKPCDDSVSVSDIMICYAH